MTLLRFYKGLIIAFLIAACLLLWNETQAAPVQSLITIDPPLVADGQSFDSLTILVEQTLMFPTVSGGAFYVQNGVKYILPISGSCQHKGASYFCVVQSDLHAFRFTLNQDTLRGSIWATKGNFTDFGVHGSTLVDAALPLKP